MKKPFPKNVFQKSILHSETYLWKVIFEFQKIFFENQKPTKKNVFYKHFPIFENVLSHIQNQNT